MCTVKAMATEARRSRPSMALSDASSVAAVSSQNRQSTRPELMTSVKFSSVYASSDVLRSGQPGLAQRALTWDRDPPSPRAAGRKRAPAPRFRECPMVRTDARTHGQTDGRTHKRGLDGLRSFVCLS
jgi:hypothetical protein